MKVFLAFILFIYGGNETVEKTKKFIAAEQMKKEAVALYRSKSYEESFGKFQYLVDSMGIVEPTVLINYGHAAFMAGKPEMAEKAYRHSLVNKNKRQNSIAYQQLGVMAAQKQQTKLALEYFKNALLQDPANEDARYNYELMLKKQEQEQQEQKNEDKQDKEDDKKEQEKKEQEKQEQKDKQEQQEKEEQKQEGKKEGEKKEGEGEEQQPEPKENRFEELKISEEKAKMILEALKNNEIQYYQQLKKKQEKKPDKGAKDW